MKDNLNILIIFSVTGIALIIIGFILLQIRNQRRLLQKQKELSAAELAHQKKLLEAEITSQEAERQRIGKDLHDEVGSVLSSLRFMIENLAEHEQSPAMLSRFNLHSKQIIDRVITNVRQLSHNLSPRISGEFGFFDAIDDLASAVNSSGAVSMHLNYTESASPPLINPGTSMALYRVLAELINNTIRHAAAKNIFLDITTRPDQISLRYRDDGKGFVFHSNSAAGNGMGMRNIESRLTIVQAQWQLKTAPGEGFNINISIPLNASYAND